MSKVNGLLYDKCSMCEGRGEVERNEGQGDWHTCFICGGEKYQPCGLTHSQFQHYQRGRDEALVRVAKLEAALSDALDALLWTGGSGDFAPEGQAYEGWQNLAQPALNNGLELVSKSEDKSDE